MKLLKNQRTTMTNRFFKIGLFLIAFFTTLTLNSCKHDIDLSTAPTISFKDDIQTIISGNCAMNGCHGNDNQSEFPLTTYNNVMEEGDVKAGNARASKFYEVLITNSGEEKMPPNGPLTNIQIKKVFLWIEQGAKDN